MSMAQTHILKYRPPLRLRGGGLTDNPDLEFLKNSVQNLDGCIARYKQQYMLAVVVMAVIFWLMALSSLPLVIINPQRFANYFSIASALSLHSVGITLGIRKQLYHMVSPKRRGMTAAYFVSMFLTMVSCNMIKSYLLSLLFCTIQFIALLYYYLSYIPGGTAFLGMFGRMIGSAFGNPGEKVRSLFSNSV